MSTEPPDTAGPCTKKLIYNRMGESWSRARTNSLPCVQSLLFLDLNSFGPFASSGRISEELHTTAGNLRETCASFACWGRKYAPFFEGHKEENGGLDVLSGNE